MKQRRMLYLGFAGLIVAMSVCLLYRPYDNPNLPHSAVASRQVQVGMTSAELDALMESGGDDSSYFAYMDYTFFVDSNGYAITVEEASNANTGDSTVIRVERQPQVPVNDEKFWHLVPGMHISEVIRQVGIPFGGPASDFVTLHFSSASGKIWVVYFDDESTMTVTDVVCRE